MNKKEFINLLKQNISSLKKVEQDEVISYYEEIILDKIESGMTEKEAIKDLGTPEAVAKKILKESKEKNTIEEESSVSKTPRSNRTLKIVLFIIFSPFIATLLLSAFVVLMSFWLVVICFYIASFLVGISGIVYIPISLGVMFKYVEVGILQIGVCLLLTGIALFWYIGTNNLMQLLVRGTKLFFKAIATAFEEVFA